MQKEMVSMGIEVLVLDSDKMCWMCPLFWLKTGSCCRGSVSQICWVFVKEEKLSILLFLLLGYRQVSTEISPDISTLLKLGAVPIHSSNLSV